MSIDEMLDFTDKDDDVLGRTLLLSAVGAAAAYLAYRYLFTPFNRASGILPHERDLWMPGDDAMTSPDVKGMGGMTIQAPPEVIWEHIKRPPGAKWMDQLVKLFDVTDAKQLLSAVGRPETVEATLAKVAEPMRLLAEDRDRMLVLTGGGNEARWTWQSALVPIEPGITRVITRVKFKLPKQLALLSWSPILSIAVSLAARAWLAYVRRNSELQFRQSLAVG